MIGTSSTGTGCCCIDKRECIPSFWKSHTRAPVYKWCLLHEGARGMLGYPDGCLGLDAGYQDESLQVKRHSWLTVVFLCFPAELDTGPGQTLMLVT